ncbi:MFS transporter [Actinomadura sp. ATCC 31491]|uniref:MFS transporter n=1 Tax=Actinomadura luzonensis TaxID=2805427 RepID=A0ABT0GBZ8_9ACTN|nr:MFS transporter [Actinomadura luzonensis]MCK2221638.1 MFS transporter [Actinomadura luzonensis]
MTTGVLRNPDFLRFLSSHLASELGANISRVALPLVAVLVLQAGPAEVGLLASLQTAAYLVIGLPAGVWVDRMRRRRVMMAADFARFVLIGSIPVAAELGVLSMPMLCVVALLAGTAQVFNDVADQTYLPRLVRSPQLADGNAKLETVRSASFLSGPAVAGALVELVGAARTISATALGSLASVLFLAAIRTSDEPRKDGERRPLLRGIGEGLSYLWHDRLLRMFVASSAMANLSVSGVLGLSVLFLSDTVRLEPGVLGALLTAGGVGGVVGGLSAGRLARRFGTARMTWAAAVIVPPFCLLLPMTQADWRASFFAITSFMISWGATMSNVGQLTYRQTMTPEHMLGRVNGSVRFLVWGTMPVGALLGGLIAAQLGVRQALWILLTGRALAFVPLLFSPLPRMREFDEAGRVQARS